MAEDSTVKPTWRHEWNEADAAWAIRHAGGVKRVRRGRRFDSFPLGTVLENEALQWRAMKYSARSWRVEYSGTPIEPGDVQGYFLDGLLTVRSLGTPDMQVTRHTPIPRVDQRALA